MPQRGSILFVTTPVKNEVLYTYLKDYDPTERDFLVQGFKCGFRINTERISTHSNDRNHPSALVLKSVVDQKLINEIRAGRIAGPFLENHLN